MKEFCMSFGERVRKKRLEKGLTQAELATKLGYKDRSSVARIENGERDVPRPTIIALADALDTTPAYLMGWEEEPTNIVFNATPTKDIKDMSPKELKRAMEDLKDFASKTCRSLTDALVEAFSTNEEWDKESEKFEKEAEYRYKALDKALIPYVPDPKERGMATSIVQQFPRLNLNGLMMLNNRIEELVRFDECISDIEKESRSAGH